MRTKKEIEQKINEFEMRAGLEWVKGNYDSYNEIKKEITQLEILYHLMKK